MPAAIHRGRTMRLSAFASSSAIALAIALSACSPGEDERPARADRAATDVSQDQAQAGLEALNITGNPQLSWESQSFEDGVYTFNDLAFTPGTEAGEGFTITQLTLAAPRVSEAGSVEFDRLELLGVDAGDTGENVRIARVFVDYPGPGLAALIGDIISGRADANGYEINAEDLTRFTFAGIGIEGVELSGIEGEEGQMSLSSFTLDEFDGEELAAMALSGFSFSAQDPETGPVRMGLSEFTVTGLDGALFAGMVNAEGDPAAAMNAMSDWMMPINFYDDMAMRDLDIDAAGVQVAMPELTGQVRERGGDIVMTSAIPSLLVTGQAGTEAGAQIASVLDMLGYDAFEFSMQGESVYDVDADRIYTRGDNYLRLEDGLVIRFDQDFGGIQAYIERYREMMADLLAEAETDTGKSAGFDPEFNQRMMEAYQPLMLNSMRIAVEDNSLVDRALQAAATQQGVQPEDVRNQLVGLIGMGVMMAPPEVPRPLIGSLSQALMTFVQQGGTLVIEADPEQAVSVGTIMQAAEAGNFDPALIGLEVSHEAADGEQ